MSAGGDDLAGWESPDSPHSWRISKPFGTGVKRKPIHFVPASTAEDGADRVEETGRDIDPSRGSSVADFYLSLVLPSEFNPGNVSHSSSSTPSNQPAMKQRAGGSAPGRDVLTSTAGIMMPSRRDQPQKASLPSEGEVSSKLLGPSISDSLDTFQESRRDEPANCLSEDAAVQPGSAVVERPIETSAALDEICPTCKARVTDWNSHVRTTAHMASEEHSKTPHHLNRQSEGYKHMVKLGWDPDGDKGLGIEGQGIRFPVKATAKKNNLGVGAGQSKSKSIRDNAGSVSDSGPKKQRLLSAKEIQRLEKAERAVRQDLHDYLRH
ncbi:hypothetical protein H072_10505 [Dactylellina haptotyla CBS 200.50]|uniref:G-patch domain-containing protein n=1 Tax=Dactylellina haptotyla (strain CBS 200.50) TaxID=1284197 RepID=S8A097_DACHA|nr:hypothetical protein H072_10505 [Dactylellina haptotyla CBS 200.50]